MTEEFRWKKNRVEILWDWVISFHKWLGISGQFGLIDIRICWHHKSSLSLNLTKSSDKNEIDFRFRFSHESQPHQLDKDRNEITHSCSVTFTFRHYAVGVRVVKLENSRKIWENFVKIRENFIWIPVSVVSVCESCNF